MRKPVLTIFYQFNPWHSTIGGIQTLIKSFIKYAPNAFEVRLVGTGVDSKQPVGQWQEAEWAGRVFQFLPLLAVENDNVRSRVPTTLKYTLALLGRCFASDFMHFYRLEPTLATLNWAGEKTLFIQNDIHKQMALTDAKDAILWRRFPVGYFALERLLVGQFDQILSCNTDSLELYRQRYPHIAEHVAFLKNTFDEEIFYPLFGEERDRHRRNLAEHLGLNEDTRFILFAGRLHPQKDPLLLIHSFAALDEPNAHLLIAGDGDLANQTRSLIEHLGLQGRVTMLGALQQSEVADLHRASNILILTSTFEGLPFVVLEALACGTPVVTTRSGETPRFLTNASGVVCDDRTPKAIAVALRQVLHHPDRYPIESCVGVVEAYSARNVIQDVYETMLSRWISQGTSKLSLPIHST
jgi:glycosyltransferase involved in cell wall biosynthesis